ncbi:CHAP domain-containing protein [Bifidobacterium bombi]|uniref:CHAP domain protein n=1 Tax=Bifidobacterium bombi DSM 19703 TaxID=1341695 RepID=A0A080N4T7_9BIFI|nr:CHAP domain-containing protein [Bifidobacterium bombi]KFF31710.1 CHAP domain protein [Bifidobacterium bombi DSM 19703]
MKHAAHKALRGGSSAGSVSAVPPTASGRSRSGSHARHKANFGVSWMRAFTDHTIEQTPSAGASHVFGGRGGSFQAAAGNGTVVNLDEAVLCDLNKTTPLTRKAWREAQKARNHKSQLLASVSLATLVGLTAVSGSLSSGRATGLDARSDVDATITRTLSPVSSSAASRSSDRDSIPDTTVADNKAQTYSHGTWRLGHDDDLDVSQMVKPIANNPRVASFMDDDYSHLPVGFNPNHDSGDTGNAYSFSECTWWAYTRRQQLGLPVGSHMGDGRMWADSARSLGYWVDNSARHVGDVLVFASGQYASDPIYGHVAVVEKINADGSVETSESGAAWHGKTFSRTFSAQQVAQLQVIHY